MFVSKVVPVKAMKAYGEPDVVLLLFNFDLNGVH